MHPAERPGLLDVDVHVFERIDRVPRESQSAVGKARALTVLLGAGRSDPRLRRIDSPGQRDLYQQVFAFSFLLLSIACGPAAHTLTSGTAAALVKTADGVVIAAESRETTVNTRTNTVTYRDDACKIQEVGNTLVVGAGLTGLNGPVLFEKARQTIVDGRSARAAALAAITAIRDDARGVRLNGAMLAELLNLQTSMPISEVLVVGRDADQLVIPWALVRAGLEDARVFEILEGDFWPIAPEGRLLGQAIRYGVEFRRLQAEERRARPGRFDEAAAVRIARGVVQYGINLNVKGVGGPIDVVVFGPSGIRWLSRKPECR
jgi:hypothetical protein